MIDVSKGKLKIPFNFSKSNKSITQKKKLFNFPINPFLNE